MASGWQGKYGIMTSPWYRLDMTKNIDDVQISARYDQKYWLLNNDRTVTCTISKLSTFCYNSISFLLSRLFFLKGRCYAAWCLMGEQSSDVDIFWCIGLTILSLSLNSLCFEQLQSVGPEHSTNKQCLPPRKWNKGGKRRQYIPARRAHDLAPQIQNWNNISAFILGKNLSVAKNATTPAHRVETSKNTS